MFLITMIKSFMVIILVMIMTESKKDAARRVLWGLLLLLWG